MILTPAQIAICLNEMAIILLQYAETEKDLEKIEELLTRAENAYRLAEALRN